MRLFFIANLASVIFALGAVYAVCAGITTGWGWLIVAALICHTSYKTDEGEGKP